VRKFILPVALSAVLLAGGRAKAAPTYDGLTQLNASSTTISTVFDNVAPIGVGLLVLGAGAYVMRYLVRV